MLFMPWANDMNQLIRHPSLMAKKERPTIRIYVAEWMAILGKKHSDLVKAGINKGYATELLEWDKRGDVPNPSLLTMEQVGRALGIEPQALLKPPPVFQKQPARVSKAQMGALADLADQARSSPKSGPKR